MHRVTTTAMTAVLVTAVAACSGDPVSNEQPDPNALEEITPEEAGFSAFALTEAVAGFQQIGSAAVVALYDGKVFLSWGEVDRKFWCHSIRKSFLSSLYGIYVGRGIIDTTKTLEELGIDDIPPILTQVEKQARVADLLKSRSGVYHPAAAETAGVAADRPARRRWRIRRWRLIRFRHDGRLRGRPDLRGVDSRGHEARLCGTAKPGSIRR